MVVMLKLKMAVMMRQAKKAARRRRRARTMERQRVKKRVKVDQRRVKRVKLQEDVTKASVTAASMKTETKSLTSVTEDRKADR